MFKTNKTGITGIFGAICVVSVAITISLCAKTIARAQENRVPGDYRNYENNDGFYRDDRDRWDKRDRRDRDNFPLSVIRPAYSVRNIKNNPAAFGARERYLDDDWDQKYLYWAPDGFDKQNIRPLVISLHGNDETPVDAFARLYFTIQQYHYAFVAPKWKFDNNAMTPEELSDFIDGIISELRDNEGVNVDSTKIILHGYERGANLAGFLGYHTPGKYAVVVVDSGPFPAIRDDSAPGAGASPKGKKLSIPAGDLKKLAGSYIYLYARWEDQVIYQKLDKSKQALIAAGAKAELNYTKNLLPGEFDESLGKSVVDMFNRATGAK